jgi:formate hydrogenlyase transcriptional activator
MTLTLQSDNSPKQYAQSAGDLRREGERLKLLLDMTNTLVSNLVTRDLLRTISASIRQCMHCDSVSVWLPKGEPGQLRSVTMEFPESRGFVKEDLLRPVEGSVLGRTFETGKPIVVRTATELSGADHDRASAEGIEFCCCLPMISRYQTLGVLALGWRDENAFSS